MRILFVDDEPAILRGIERMLVDRRESWRMVFAVSGEEALKAMGGEEFDVIVSDMRMPGMDGGELLSRVQELYPGILRIILSGHSDRELVMRTVQTAHQFLSKPCVARDLIQTLTQSFELKSILTDPLIRKTVSRLGTLPVLPAVYAQLMEALKGQPSLHELGDIVSRDIGLTSGILKIVNSSFFGLRRGISTPAQAISYLGVNTLRGMILFHNVFSTLDPVRQLPFVLNGLYEHSLRTAFFAAEIARSDRAGRGDTDVSFIAGLLHDVGKLVLAVGLPEYGEIVGLCQEQNIPLAKAEEDRLGVTHAAVGAYLLGLWGFDPEIVKTVAGHNHPGRLRMPPPGALAFVHAANSLEHELVVVHPGYAPHAMDLGYAGTAGWLEKINDWRELCAGTLGGAGDQEITRETDAGGPGIRR